MLGDLKGRVAIVTGAAMGNGKGGALMFAKHGAHTVLADISPKVFETEKEFKDLGYSVSAYIVNVSDAAACKEVVEKVVAEHGKVDIAMNNAGVCRLKAFVDFPAELLDFHINVNIRGVWNMSQAVFPYMMKARYGRIVNMSSVTGPMVVDTGETAYAMTKGAVWGLTKALAYEGAPYNITCNAICPGYIHTPMVEAMAAESCPENPESVIAGIASTIPMGRLGRIEDLGNLALFLGSEESGYITGTQVVIDGGSTLPETAGAMHG